MKYANAQAIPIAIIMGPDEAAQGQAIARDPRSGQQQVVKQDQIVEEVVNLFRGRYSQASDSLKFPRALKSR